MDVVLADDTLACIEEEVVFVLSCTWKRLINYFHQLKDMEDGEELREVDDDFMDDEQSLSRSMSQMTTRGETTQPDDDTHNVEVRHLWLWLNDMN